MSKVKLDYLWIARDRNGDLNIGTDRPDFDKDSGWWVNWDDYMELPKSIFREVTYKNSPQKVELTIEIKNEQG